MFSNEKRWLRVAVAVRYVLELRRREVRDLAEVRRLIETVEVAIFCTWLQPRRRAEVRQLGIAEGTLLENEVS